ncbi:MAG: hypothetical protein EXS58_06165 [Candidatus Latescibacteria bacterium]|nr:hypothetical protein [Candidatus Latescibacterota bacterium]
MEGPPEEALAGHHQQAHDGGPDASVGPVLPVRPFGGLHARGGIVKGITGGPVKEELVGVDAAVTVG